MCDPALTHPPDHPHVWPLQCGGPRASSEWRSALRRWTLALASSRDFNNGAAAAAASTATNAAAAPAAGLTAVIRSYFEPAILHSKRQASVVAMLDLLAELTSVRKDHRAVPAFLARHVAARWLVASRGGELTQATSALFSRLMFDAFAGDARLIADWLARSGGGDVGGNGGLSGTAAAGSTPSLPTAILAELQRIERRGPPPPVATEAATHAPASGSGAVAGAAAAAADASDVSDAPAARRRPHARVSTDSAGADMPSIDEITLVVGRRSRRSSLGAPPLRPIVLPPTPELLRPGYVLRGGGDDDGVLSMPPSPRTNALVSLWTASDGFPPSDARGAFASAPALLATVHTISHTADGSTASRRLVDALDYALASGRGTASEVGSARGCPTDIRRAAVALAEAAGALSSGDTVTPSPQPRPSPTEAIAALVRSLANEQGGGAAGALHVALSHAHVVRPLLRAIAYALRVGSAIARGSGGNAEAAADVVAAAAGLATALCRAAPGLVHSAAEGDAATFVAAALDVAGDVRLVAAAPVAGGAAVSAAATAADVFVSHAPPAVAAAVLCAYLEPIAAWGGVAAGDDDAVPGTAVAASSSSGSSPPRTGRSVAAAEALLQQSAAAAARDGPRALAALLAAVHRTFFAGQGAATVAARVPAVGSATASHGTAPRLAVTAVAAVVAYVLAVTRAAGAAVAAAAAQRSGPQVVDGVPDASPVKAIVAAALAAMRPGVPSTSPTRDASQQPQQRLPDAVSDELRELFGPLGLQSVPATGPVIRSVADRVVALSLLHCAPHAYDAAVQPLDDAFTAAVHTIIATLPPSRQVAVRAGLSAQMATRRNDGLPLLRYTRSAEFRTAPVPVARAPLPPSGSSALPYVGTSEHAQQLATVPSATSDARPVSATVCARTDGTNCSVVSALRGSTAAGVGPRRRAGSTASRQSGEYERPPVVVPAVAAVE